MPEPERAPTPASSLASLADALGRPTTKGRGLFERPDWRLSVRRRGEPELVPIEDLPGVGPIDDWDVTNPGIGRLFSTAVLSGGEVAWDQYGVDEGPLSPGEQAPAAAGRSDPRRRSGAIVIPFVRTPDGGCKVGMIKHERTIPGVTTLELPRGFAKPNEREILTAVREFLEEFSIDRSTSLRVVDTKRIAQVNPNTAFFTGWIGVYACEFEAVEPDQQPPDPLEPIVPWNKSGTTGLLVPLKWLSTPGAISCALSAAALWHFQAFLKAPLQPLAVDSPGAPVDHERFLSLLEGPTPSVRTTESLTPRELEVLELIKNGHTNQRIADALGISEKTVATHVSHVLGKLGVESRTEAASLALKSSLLGSPQ